MKQETNLIIDRLKHFADESLKDGAVNKIIDYDAIYSVIDNLLSVAYILEQESL